MNCLLELWPFSLALSVGLATAAGVRVVLAVRRHERETLVSQHAREMAARQQGAR